MSTSKIAARYAKSFIDLATEKQQIEEVHKDILSFKSAMESRDFYLLLKSPIVNSAKKLEIVKQIFGDKLNVITSSFVNLIITKRREIYFPEIVDEFISQYKESKNIATAKLVTASEVDESLLSQVRSFLQKETGKTDIEMEVSVDASLIGGFVLKFGDKLYDSSVKSKLSKLQKSFSKNKYIREF